MNRLFDRENKLKSRLTPVLYIPHGAGPLPLLGDKNHAEMVDFLKEMASILPKPSVILLISAHWEEKRVTITSGDSPSLIYDYSGFPDAAYQIEYPAPGALSLAEKIYHLLENNGIEAHLDPERGFDHGLFVPLKIMYPAADIPCVQLSLLQSLDPKIHMQLGQELSSLREEDILIVGSGFSFHNLNAFFSQPSEGGDNKNQAFEAWLIDTCTNANFSAQERALKLSEWHAAPFARYCHPREEHLLPLHVCYGIAQTTAKLVFDGKVLGKKTSAYLW